MCIKMPMNNIVRIRSVVYRLIQNQIATEFLRFKYGTENYLDPGRNIDPLMKTAPDNRTYQHDDSSPVL